NKTIFSFQEFTNLAEISRVFFEFTFFYPLNKEKLDKIYLEEIHKKLEEHKNIKLKKDLTYFEEYLLKTTENIENNNIQKAIEIYKQSKNIAIQKYLYDRQEINDLLTINVTRTINYEEFITNLKFYNSILVFNVYSLPVFSKTMFLDLFSLFKNDIITLGLGYNNKENKFYLSISSENNKFKTRIIFETSKLEFRNR
ncbi:MAG: hypothetical protein NC925_04815, partial [Candidatus Omnitrophica bacterium]|nr:hypothetical protein [Candidatus Omnitrophota bacterium]